MTDAPTQPPSPAQRILDIVKELADYATNPDDPSGQMFMDARVQTVRAALKEMDEHFHRAHTEGIDAVVKALTERHKEEVAGIIAQEKEDAKAERARAVAKMEALKIDSGYKNIVIPGIQDVNCAIDACIKVLKGDQA